jgi:hypothetical protein
VASPDALYKGVVCIEEYITLEVYKGQYKLLRPHLWSCGKKIEEFCSGSELSVDHSVLINIASL